MNQPKDIKEFCKLFDLYIPTYEYFDYYIDLLSKYPKHSDIKNNLEEFIRIEQSLHKEGKEIFKYKMACVDQIVNNLKASEAYAKLNELIYTPITPQREFKAIDGDYTSIDLSSANFHALSFFDKTGQMKTYEDILRPAFGDNTSFYAKPKSLRQFIFGNTNPKRLQLVQKMVIDEMMQYFDYETKTKLVSVKSDELIFSGNVDINLPTDNTLINHFPTKIKKYKLEVINDGVTIKTFSNGEKQFYGINGNRFFMYFKKYFLNESLNYKDLIFKIDNRTALWTDGVELDTLKIN
jgi:hypothetical protein